MSYYLQATMGVNASASETFLLGLEIPLRQGFPSWVSRHVGRSDEVRELSVPAETPVSTDGSRAGVQKAGLRLPTCRSRGTQPSPLSPALLLITRALVPARGQE